MKQVQLSAYGVPEQVARCVEVPDVGAPTADEVVFDVLLFPINPADVSFCRGGYRLKPPLPATPGAECVGRVAAVGDAVDHVKPGDLVINLQRENWAQRRRVKGSDVIRLPDGMDLQQAAMVRINPPTASLLLSDIVDLLPGDWVIQNVANSAVGKLVIRLARGRGLHTLNVVRRESLFDELSALGADACVLDGPDLWQRAREATENAPIKLGIDAVAGEATGRLSGCVADGGTVCNYGSMSGLDPIMGRADVIYRGVDLTGFMLGRFLAKKPVEQIRALYAELADRVMSGDLNAPVERVYPIEEIQAALARAQQGERAGKILVAPNGPV